MPARAAARADTVLVRYEPPAGGLRGVAAGLSRRGHAGRLAVEPPEHPDAGWRRDLPGDMPERGVGEKAWRISRALSVVTPAHWEEHFGVTPSDLIAAARGDWEMALLAGWCRASVLHRESSWAAPLWRACYRLEHDLEGWQTWQIALSMANLLPQSDLAFAIGQLPKNWRDAISTFFYAAGDLRSVATGPVRGFSRRPAQAHQRHLPIRAGAGGRAVGNRPSACLYYRWHPSA